MSTTKNLPLNWYSSMKKKIEKDSDNFWRGKLTLNVRNWQFLITWLRAGVDLPENFCYEKVLFSTQLGKLPFDAEVAEISWMVSTLHVCTMYITV